jgi:hypothetical protein
MTTTITGADGVSKVQTGAIEHGDLPSGSVLQVIHFRNNTELTIATTTYTDSGLTITMTPKSTSSKILVSWNLQAMGGASGSGIGVKLLRDTTALYTSATQYEFYIAGFTGIRGRFGWTYLDSPATTSAITYKIQVGSYNNTSNTINQASNTSDMTLMEIAG